MYSFANETEDYRAKRQALLEAEMALRDQRETVAALRRDLPAGPVVEDYRFLEGPRSLAAGDAPIEERRLSELFEQPDKPLILVHFMFGKAQTAPCPMCTMMADSYQGIARHLEQSANFAAVIAGDVAAFRAFARSRGWHDLRIVSAGESSIKRDSGVESDEGGQLPAISIFTRDADGTVRHFYSGGALMAEGEYRGLDLTSPVWHFLDLLPGGRGDWLPSLDYERTPS